MKVGFGTVVLSGANTYSGLTDIVQGTLLITNPSALGSAAAGTTVQEQEGGATLEIASTVPGFTVAEPLTLSGIGANGLGALRSVGPGTHRLTGAVTLAASSRIEVFKTTSLVVDVAISGPGALTKTEIGTLILNGSNTYSGATTVNAGTLLVNGKQPGSPVIVNSSATLGGNGTVGPLTVNPGGTVNPGVNGPGILTVNGDAAFSMGSSFVAELMGITAGSGYDQLRVTGRADLGGAKLVALFLGGFTSTTGDSFAIVESTDPPRGRFEGLRQREVFQVGSRLMRIDYHGADRDVVLTDVGPFGSALLGALLE